MPDSAAHGFAGFSSASIAPMPRPGRGLERDGAHQQVSRGVSVRRSPDASGKIIAKAVAARLRWQARDWHGRRQGAGPPRLGQYDRSR
jgi:hypothetical protein